MKEVFTVKYDASSLRKELEKLGISDCGSVQEFMLNEIMRLSRDYTPFGAGALMASARISEDKKAIEYHSRYAQYHWFGKLMVDPITKKGAFFSPEYGFWSRPNVQKELTDRDLRYNGAPTRGPRWVERCVIDNAEVIAKSVADKIKENSK